jgi:hypothetical protein
MKFPFKAVGHQTRLRQQSTLTINFSLCLNLLNADRNKHDLISLVEDKDNKDDLRREFNNLKAKVEKTEEEVALKYKLEFEETRRCLLNIAHSKNQTHAGYLIAVVIGALTLISRWDIFLNPTQKLLVLTTIIFFILVSTMTAGTAYLIQRTFYWTTYGTSVLNMSSSDAEELFKRYKTDPKHKSLQEHKSPLSCILNGAVAQHIEDMRMKKNEGLTTKFAVMGDRDVILLSGFSWLISFLVLLNIWLVVTYLV